MNKIAIYGQSYSLTTENEVQILLSVLEEQKVVVYFEKQFYTLLNQTNSLPKAYLTFERFEDLNSSFDLLFTIGGDGTILRAVTYVRDLGIPILGINAGRLGFLATIKKEAIRESVACIFNKAYSIQERSLLCVATSPEVEGLSDLNFALNEVTISRKNTTSMIGVKTYLDQEYLTNYWADGLIIATPTGSTGYSLSCNGPVILPASKSLVITPIAPHNLNARPMVIPDDTAIELEIDTREKEFLISLDSRIITVPNNTKVSIKKASFTVKSILPNNQSFLQTLRSKLLWGEDIRNEPNL
ncbi:NAD kinase [Polaribacter sp. HL-MS24]|uniref:NAD kinase n=1 Tax=Polaribacter sp. HL-MS24 TaxID=3077735 RepID=UPI002934A98F|nr:NAD kinase [Polaribacter sp. HL-MS24]WOC39451.1 NAD kinase [Polaribacter sp. HL-MS24]